MEKQISEARKILEEFFDIFNVAAELSPGTIQDGEEGRKYLHLKITGDGLNDFIGFHGRALDSLQHIVNLAMLNNPRNNLRVVLDVNGFKSRREDYLKSLAERAVIDVVESGQAVHLPPMKPSERRVVHMVIKQNSNVDSESEGEGPDRHIVVTPLK